MRRSPLPLRLIATMLVCVFSPDRCLGIWLNVPDTGTKCVSEDIHPNVVVLADYVVVSNDHSWIPSISVKVTSPYGSNLYHKENATHGQFAFTTKEGGNYLACFWVDGNNQGGGDVSVNIDWKNGIAAKDWDSVARKEKIEVFEREHSPGEGDVIGRLVFAFGMGPSRGLLQSAAQSPTHSFP